MKGFLAALLRRIARALGIPDIHHRLDTAHADLLEIVAQQQALSKFYEHRFQELLNHIDFLTKERDEEILIQLRRHVTDLRQSIQKISAIRPSEQIEPTSSSEKTYSSTKPVVDDVLYINLEDKFRGNPANIRERQKQYLPYIKESVDSKFPLVDIGFGRGEWLELLLESGIPASGIDSNEVSVTEARNRGLDVSCIDILDFLRSTPSESLGAITMFQVMEHLPFDVLVETFQLCVRVLRPGGVLIAEIPNSETLAVGASTFWIDPTHQRPLFPAVLRFLASEVGFTSIEGLYSTPLAPDPSLESIPEPDRSEILKMHRIIQGPADFALIAKA